MSGHGGFEGMAGFLEGIAKLNEAMDHAAHANARDGSAMLVRAAMNNFEGAHKKNEPRVPNASNKPNIVTGNLRRSIRSSSIRHVSPGVYESTVGPTAIYGRRVELGFNDKGSYPYFGPAVKHTRGHMQAVATANWAKYLT